MFLEKLDHVTIEQPRLFNLAGMSGAMEYSGPST